jgi:NTE family protein
MRYNTGMKINPRLKWALVLSGGGAKGLAHVGVLKVLSDMGVPEPSLVVGTSMGSIVGGLYACGMTADELLRFTSEEFDIFQHLESFTFKMNGPVGKVLQTGQMIGNLVTKSGVDSGAQLLELFEKLTAGKTFAETRLPFRCNAVDLATGEEVVFDSGPVAFAMRASMSFPGFFEPLFDGGRCLVDGGLADNMPVAIARKLGFKHILAVDVGNFTAKNASDFKAGYQILFRCLAVILYLREKQKTERANLTISAGSDASTTDFHRKEELIELGERSMLEAREQVEEFFAAGTVGSVASGIGKFLSGWQKKPPKKRLDER